MSGLNGTLASPEAGLADESGSSLRSPRPTPVDHWAYLVGSPFRSVAEVAELATSGSPAVGFEEAFADEDVLPEHEDLDEVEPSFQAQTPPGTPAVLQVTRANAAAQRLTVDQVVRSTFKLSGENLAGKLRLFDSAISFGKAVPKRDAQDLITHFLSNPDLRPPPTTAPQAKQDDRNKFIVLINRILRHQQIVNLYGPNVPDSLLRGWLAKVRKVVAQRIGLGTFAISQPSGIGGGQTITTAELVAEIIAGLTTMPAVRANRRVLMPVPAPVEVLVHEACHFYAHPNFIAATRAQGSNQFFIGLAVDQILLEGLAETYALEVMRANTTKLGGIDMEDAYEGYVEAAGRFIDTAGVTAVRSAYFGGSAVAIKRLFRAIELNRTYYPLLVPDFMLEAEAADSEDEGEAFLGATSAIGVGGLGPARPLRTSGTLRWRRRQPKMSTTGEFEVLSDEADWEDEGLEEDTPLSQVLTLPGRAIDALRQGAWEAAVVFAIASGNRDVNQLTNMVFWSRHPAMTGQKIGPEQRDLAREWLDIRDRLVTPAVRRASAPSSTPAAPTPPNPAQPVTPIRRGLVKIGKNLALDPKDLDWYGAQPAPPGIHEFMRKVYELCVLRAKGNFVDTLPDDATDYVEGRDKLRNDAVPFAKEMLKAARRAMEVAGKTGARIGIVSAYRPASRQWEIWQGKGERNGGFVKYYNKTSTLRARTKDRDPHGAEAAKILADRLAPKIAAPGYSNHQDGLALDLGTAAGQASLGVINEEAWFYRWLCEHAGEYNFCPYEKEAWHWVFHPEGCPDPQGCSDRKVKRELPTSWELGETPAIIPAGEHEIRSTALLKRHRGVQPDVILRWNAMPADVSEVDVVVHFHGNSWPRANLRRHLMVWSGLDLEPVDGAAGSGRTRPTLTILPRGDDSGIPQATNPKANQYGFPALVAANGLNKLIALSLDAFSREAKLPLPKIGRRILNAHSSGGRTLLRVVLDQNPDEVHVYDALYWDPTPLIEWATKRVQQDKTSTKTTPGALRVFYRGGTATNSGKVRDGIAQALSGASADLVARYRVEPSTYDHFHIPRQYGWRMLADASANVPGIRASRPKRPVQEFEDFGFEDGEEANDQDSLDSLSDAYRTEAWAATEESEDEDGEEANDQDSLDSPSDAYRTEAWAATEESEDEDGEEANADTEHGYGEESEELEDSEATFEFADEEDESDEEEFEESNDEHESLADLGLGEEYDDSGFKTLWEEESPPALLGESPTARPDLGVTAKQVDAYDWAFTGRRGKRFKAMVVSAANAVGLDPGLVAENLIAEGRRDWYLSNGRLTSYNVGADDFYAKRHDIAQKVPAYTKVRWDRKSANSHANDASKPRTVVTIDFLSGPDAALGNAVYVKHGEEVLRAAAKAAGKDFDTLPIEVRFALVRIAINAGHGRALRNLREALADQDILIRTPQKKAGPQRNATIHAARAIHLSSTVFGTTPREAQQ